jgi:hypothetical protein
MPTMRTCPMTKLARVLRICDGAAINSRHMTCHDSVLDKILLICAGGGAAAAGAAY